MALKLDPRFPVVWRSPDSLQLGLDAPRVLLNHVSTAHERMLAALAVGVTRAGLAMIGTESGLDADDIAAFERGIRPALATRTVTVPTRAPRRVVTIDGSGPTADRLEWRLREAELDSRRVTRSDPADEPTITYSYQLQAPLVAQDGRKVGLDLYRGGPVLVTMFYAGCQATCPLIIDTLRAVEKKLPPEQMKDLRVLLVSIDPENDTPTVLAATARERRVDTGRWTLAHADERTVRLVAAALGVQYRKLPDGEFSHATQISVLDAQGRIVAQSTMLGRVDEKLVAAIGRR